MEKSAIQHKNYEAKYTRVGRGRIPLIGRRTKGVETYLRSARRKGQAIANSNTCYTRCARRITSVYEHVVEKAIT